MKHRLVSQSVLLLALFLAMAPTAMASTTWYVDGVNGNDNNDCKTPQTACRTIGQAISLASSGDSIIVAAATYTENLTIDLSLRVIGAGAKTTIIDGGDVDTVVTIFNTSARVTLSMLTVRNGHSGRNPSGGVDNIGTPTINNSTISGNSASGCGGGIYNNGTLTINNSTLSGNNAYPQYRGFGGSGGGICNNKNGTMKINDSTLSGNMAHGRVTQLSHGGGIVNVGTLTISNSTLSGNSAIFGGDIQSYPASTTVLQNTIVANSLSGGTALAP
jgi:hypothetical protein